MPESAQPEPPLRITQAWLFEATSRALPTKHMPLGKGESAPSATRFTSVKAAPLRW